MPLASDRFDVVLCTYGAHHMDPTALLAELRRVLRPGGRLVMAAAGAPAAWRARPARPLIEMLTASARLLDRHARMQAEVEAFRNIRTSAEWRRLLADSGFVHADVAERRPRRPWYPRDLRIKAQARESEPHRSLNRHIEWREMDK
jgi:SAM-dependent methyltransferase